MASKVYFKKEVSPQSVVELYDVLGIKLDGKVAVKLHSGERGNQNYIKPEFFRDIIGHVGGTVVECNTAYEGARNTTEKHTELMKEHGWSEMYDVDIMDAEGDMQLEVKGGKQLDVNFVGKNFADYDSVLVLSHFKGHPMGGFGGALKNISIGIASSYGKAYIHGVKDVDNFWNSDHDSFLEAMADAAKSVTDYKNGKMAFINVMCNMSVDCDCCEVAEDPCMADIGVLASLDPVALDQACLDLVYQSSDPGRDHLIERIESRNGVHTVEAAAEIGVGEREYELVTLG